MVSLGVGKVGGWRPARRRAARRVLSRWPQRRRLVGREEPGRDNAHHRVIERWRGRGYDGGGCRDPSVLVVLVVGGGGDRLSGGVVALRAPDGGVEQSLQRRRRGVPEGHVLAAQLVQHVVRDGRGGGGWRSFKPLRRELVVRVQPRFVVHPVDAPARLGVQFFKDRRGDARGFVPRADRVERAAQRAARVARTEPTKQRR